MSIIINPGSGPVEGATLANAEANMSVFLKDVGVGALTSKHLSNLDRDGRFGFRAEGAGQTHTIEMPGLPIAQVRYMGVDGQNIWHFPRLYVDGSSWVWLYAINCWENQR